MQGLRLILVHEERRTGQCPWDESAYPPCASRYRTRSRNVLNPATSSGGISTPNASPVFLTNATASPEETSESPSPASKFGSLPSLRCSLARSLTRSSVEAIAESFCCCEHSRWSEHRSRQERPTPKSGPAERTGLCRTVPRAYNVLLLQAFQVSASVNPHLGFKKGGRQQVRFVSRCTGWSPCSQELIAQCCFKGELFIPPCPIMQAIPDSDVIEQLTERPDLSATVPLGAVDCRFDIVLRSRHSILFDNRLEGNRDAASPPPPEGVRLPSRGSRTSMFAAPPAQPDSTSASGNPDATLRDRATTVNGSGTKASCEFLRRSNWKFNCHGEFMARCAYFWPRSPTSESGFVSMPRRSVSERWKYAPQMGAYVEPEVLTMGCDFLSTGACPATQHLRPGNTACASRDR